MKSGAASAKLQTKGRKTSKTSEPPQSHDERYAAGKALRNRLEREAHSKWTLPKSGRDPVKLVVESSKGRIPELVPIRYGRMMVSPFTFYRGTANIMAADLVNAGHRNTSTALRRLPFAESRRVRNTRASLGLRHERLRRNAARTVGMGCETTSCQFHHGVPVQWVFQVRSA